MKLDHTLSWLVLFAAVTTHAHIIGTNTPAEALTMKRVADLPTWKTYLENSQRQRLADQAFLQAELKAHQLTRTTEPKAVRNATGLSLTQPPAWYAGAEARRLV